MTPKRKFSSKTFQHLYQISVDKSLIFCTVPDRILLYTLICVRARKYNVRITQLCIMFNHFHIQASMSNKETMERFMSSVTWSFAIVFNHHYGLKGPVFHRPFGSAPKVQTQKIVGNMIYIANNPIGKKATTTAWDYRWNFLRYAPQLIASTGTMEYSACARHPFSEEYNPLEASREMLYLVKVVRLKVSSGEAIDYKLFESSKYASLCEKERLQLIDIIIATYNVIDYEPMLRKYGSVEQFCRVLTEVEGCEYDLTDDWESENYRHYEQMITIAIEEGYDIRNRRFAGIQTTETCSASGKTRAKSGKTMKNESCLGYCPSQANDSLETHVLPREIPESKEPLMPIDMAERLIKRFKNEVGATNLEIKKFLKTNEYGKH